MGLKHFVTQWDSSNDYDETAYIKGRFIGESTRLIHDILYHTEEENIDGVLFAADVGKAFDSVEHIFIFEVQFQCCHFLTICWRTILCLRKWSLFRSQHFFMK